MNKVILSGNTTKDAEIRTTNDGLAIARGTIAVKRMKDGTDFINFVAFGKTAELIEKYVPKGKKILIEGYWQTGSYEKDGKKVYTNECLVDSLEFLDKKEATPPPIDSNDFQNIADVDASELPFQ